MKRRVTAPLRSFDVRAALDQKRHEVVGTSCGGTVDWTNLGLVVSHSVGIRPGVQQQASGGDVAAEERVQMKCSEPVWSLTIGQCRIGGNERLYARGSAHGRGLKNIEFTPSCEDFGLGSVAVVQSGEQRRGRSAHNSR